MLSCMQVISVTRSAARSVLPELLKHRWPHAVGCVRTLAELKAAKGVRSKHLLLEQDSPQACREGTGGYNSIQGSSFCGRTEYHR